MFRSTGNRVRPDFLHSGTLFCNGGNGVRPHLFVKFRLDHVVIAVADLAVAIADYGAMGFTVLPGGRHPGRTSENALVVFDDGAYLELIAWPQPGPAERWYNVLAKHGEGFMDFALIPSDVPRAIDEAKARGLALNGPIEGGRVRPDGARLEWRTGRQTTFDLPFLCGDVTPRELRVPEGDVRRHANGAQGIATVTSAVFDIDASVRRYRALLGEGARVADPVVLPALGVRVAIIELGTSAAIVLASPSGVPAMQAPPFANELAQRLERRGEGPCALAIRTAGGTRRFLDLALSHGAPIEIGP